MKKIFLVFLILFLCVSSALAYSVEVKTYNTFDRYEKVVRHSFTEDYLIIYILDSFDNYKIMIRNSSIINIKIIMD